MSQAQAIRQNDVPVTFMKIMANELPGVENGGGLILTEANILGIKRYVKKGLSLPHTLEAVVENLGMQNTGIDGLEPKDILVVLQAVRGNTLQWNDLERDIKTQAIRLDHFALKVTEMGSAILNIIAAMPIMTQVMQTVGASDIGSSTNLQFTSNDGMIATNLSEVLKFLRGDIEEEKNLTDKLKTRIHNFYDVIHNDLDPAVQNKREIMKRNNLDGDIVQLADQIDRLTDSINQLKKDYDKFTGLAFTGAAGGPLGLIITGSIFGSKAEAARKLKNEKIAEKNNLVSQLSHKKRLRQTIEIMSNQFADVQGHLKDAEAAVANLAFVWETIAQSIDESIASFSKVNDSQSLLIFKLAFSNIINPWKTVKDYASKLAALLESALLTYNAIVMAENA
jgi:hypothetical protein